MTRYAQYVGTLPTERIDGDRVVLNRFTEPGAGLPVVSHRCDRATVHKRAILESARRPARATVIRSGAD